jgi:hypothetical protein
MAKALALVLLLLGAGAAWAQTPAPPAGEPETVYSDAQRQKDDQLSRRFVQSLLRPSYSLEGQFAKWKHPICPHVVGMQPSAAYFVERRIRDVAQRIGAPLDRRDPCKPNIVVFVTGQPQALLDTLAEKELWLFAASSRQELTVRFPVQSWYFGYFIDDKGFRVPDIPFEDVCAWCSAPSVPANDTRLRLGIRPDMTTATILVDSSAIAGLTLGSFGDYLALMALAQAPATGRCQPAPSIANLFLKDCDSDFHTTALSDADMAMLTALYQTPDEPEKLQAQRLIANMRRNLEGEQK